MPRVRRRLAALSVCALTAVTCLPAGAHAPDIIDTWRTVTIPPPPTLQPASVDSRDTALLLLDFSVATCKAPQRPSCVRSIPRVAKLLEQARRHHMLVVYSVGGKVSHEIPAPLAKRDHEPTVAAGVDKFFRTDLERILVKGGIHTVIVTGTSAHGAVLYTASGAALRGLRVIVPVDGMSADNPFAELYTAWQLVNAPGSVSSHVTLTRTDLITIH
jgi:nicotinamidase-related amidase